MLKTLVLAGLLFFGGRAKRPQARPKPLYRSLDDPMPWPDWYFAVGTPAHDSPLSTAGQGGGSGKQTWRGGSSDEG